MGKCCSSQSDAIGQKQSDVTDPGRNRRLSVGNVDNAATGQTADSVQADRGLIAELNETDIIAMLGESSGDRKFSLGSETDQNKKSFTNKSIKEYGKLFSTQDMALGYTCRKGLKPESPNQDSWSLLKVDKEFAIYGVYDGHGKTGHDVSNFVKENLPKLILKDQRFKGDNEEMKNLLLDNFKKIQSLVATADRKKMLSAQMAGTTATVVVHDFAKNQLTVGHVADSTCVLGKWRDADKKELEGIALTRDHKPDLPDERKRIESAGARIVFDGVNHRVYAKNGRYPGLNMSRCLGDLLGHAEAGCSAEPEVNTRPIDPLDHILLLCSDGVWEFITPQEAVNIVNQFEPAKAQEAADALAKKAWDMWIQEEQGQVVDDITVVLIFLNLASPPQS